MKPIAKLAEYGRREGLRATVRLGWNTVRWHTSAALGRPYLRRRVHDYLMELRVGDPGVSRALALFGSREELETEVVRREIRPGMVVLDLGANIGYYTLLAASLVGPSGKVYAIEPFPDNLSLLRRNIALNGLSDRVETFSLAVADRSGRAALHLGAANNLHTLVGADAERGTIEVPTTTLSDFLADKPPVDFIRMDIEGGECQVFDGMDDVLRQSSRPAIFFEVHPRGTVDPDPGYTTRLERLLASGYRCRYAISSFHPTAIGRYRDLGYEPIAGTPSGQALFAGIANEHLPLVAARRPKITRALLLALPERQPVTTAGALGERDVSVGVDEPLTPGFATSLTRRSS